MDPGARAESFWDDGGGTFEELAELVRQLLATRRFGPLAPLLIVAARRALYSDWEPADRLELAEILKDNQQFGYARKLFGRLRAEDDGADPEQAELLRQRQGFCTYKDLELPATRRLDRALEILGPPSPARGAEALGLIGAVYKRRWEVDAKRADLESALRCYQWGYELEGDEGRWYAGINAAFVADQLASLEDAQLGPAPAATQLRELADRVREEIVAGMPAGDDWYDATLAEAHLGLGDLERAQEHLRRAREKTTQLWKQESTAMQMAALARLRRIDEAEATRVLEALLGDAGAAARRGHAGKVGLALSGGGFRASLFHIGVLARLAECDLLRRVEVLSCVSGGSIVGAHYYLKLRQLLQSKKDGDVRAEDYLELVSELAEEFFAAVRRDLRGRLFTNLLDDAKMMTPGYSRTNRIAELLERLFYSKVKRSPEAELTGPWRMTELFVTPAGRGRDFSLRYENWLRAAKVPMLVLNATTLNTGHAWQYTASWMGEPPSSLVERVDASRRLRRLYYRDAPPGHREPTLAEAVAASACVPMLFPPLKLRGLYDGVDIELIDGGVHDNQGVASLLEQDCTAILVSDASGQASDEERPGRRLLEVAKRSNSVLMARVREAQFGELADRRRSGVLRNLMFVHLTKGLPARPRDWHGCQEPYRPDDDALPDSAEPGRSPYGIDPEIQRALAELRTDLDRFSEREAHSLMAAGYLMAKRDLAAMSSLPVSPPPGGARAWPFAAALRRLTDESPPADDLLAELRAGRSRFLRGPKALIERRKERGKWPW